MNKRKYRETQGNEVYIIYLCQLQTKLNIFFILPFDRAYTVECSDYKHYRLPYWFIVIHNVCLFILCQKNQ